MSEKLKKGDRLRCPQIDNEIEVVAVLEEMIFTRDHNSDGSVSPFEGPLDPKDLYTYGYRKIN